jgi:hypothetical protein
MGVYPIEREQLSKARNTDDTSGKAGTRLPCKVGGNPQFEAPISWKIMPSVSNRFLDAFMFHCRAVQWTSRRYLVSA